MRKPFKIIVEKHPDGYVAYPLGLKGVVIGEGDTYEDALADAKSAIRFHIETFGKDVIVMEAFVANRHNFWAVFLKQHRNIVAFQTPFK